MNDASTKPEPIFDLSSLNLPDLTESFFTDKQAANSDGEKFVVFFLEDALFAIPARLVTEVIRPIPFTPLPEAPSWLDGIANLRGEVISVINLLEFCQKKSAPLSAKSKFIVLRPKNYNSAVAFPIDKLNEIVTLTKDEIDSGSFSFFSGTADYQSGSLYLLDTDKIFSSLLSGA